MVIERNKRKFNKAVGSNPLTEMMNTQKEEDLLHTEFVNSIEKALFGEFNAG
jgi:hypothetical protein